MAVLSSLANGSAGEISHDGVARRSMTSERAIRSTRSLVLILITAFLTTNTAACTLLDKVEKVSKTPGLEEVLEREAGNSDDR